MDIFGQIVDNVKRKKNKFKTLKCNPVEKETKINKTMKSCYDKNSMKLLKKIWNKRYPDSKISSRNPKKIWENIQTNLKSQCDNELCWIEQIVPQNDKKKFKHKFAPIAPVSWKYNLNEWLSSKDLRDVMRQYEEKHKDFVFLGPSPIDFDEKVSDYCVWPELCDISMRKLINRKKEKIGIIFNTDKHNQSGSHWIALFIDIKRKSIFFFDSNGNPIPYEVQVLMDKIDRQCNKLGINMKQDSNVDFRHQDTNTECGMYCLYFIINIVEDIHSFKYFKKTRIPDSKVESLRKQYFNLLK
jgi:hypothetical protein